MSPSRDEILKAQRAAAQKLAVDTKRRGKIIPFRQSPNEPDCLKCEDRVWVHPGPYCNCRAGERSERLWSQYQTSQGEVQERRRRQAAAELRRVGGFIIPERYKHYTPKGLAEEYGRAVYNQKKLAIERAMNWADGKLEKAGIVLSGDFGVGKTALAIWAMSRRIRRTKEAALLIRYADFIGSIQETYNRNSNVSRRQLITGAQAAEVMMLDDFGEVGLPLGQQASNDKQTILLEVLDYRTQNDSPTLIVTNLTIARMMAQFNGAIIGRLTELCALVEMGGKNLREKGAVGWQ